VEGVREEVVNHEALGSITILWLACLGEICQYLTNMEETKRTVDAEFFFPLSEFVF
jgi:hypothetical protein